MTRSSRLSGLQPPVRQRCCRGRSHPAQLVVALLPMIVLGCATPQSTLIVLQEPFDEQSARAFMQPGANSLLGRVESPGLSRNVAELRVVSAQLVPATPYAVERMRATFGTDHMGVSLALPPRISPDPPAYRTNMLQGEIDANGMIHFHNVKDGDYFVVAEVAILIPGNTSPTAETRPRTTYRVRNGNQIEGSAFQPPGAARGQTAARSEFLPQRMVMMRRVAVDGGRSERFVLAFDAS